MDEKKKMEGGFEASTDRPREVWGAADRDGSSGRYAAGEVRSSRDLTDSERGQLLSGYTTSDADQRVAGEFSGSPGTASPLGGTSEAATFGVGSSGDVGFSAEAEPRGRVAGARQKVKEKASEAKAKVAQTARARVDQGKDQVADRLEGGAELLEERLNDKATELISQIASKADVYVSRATQVLREKDADQLLLLAKDEFRHRPLAVAAGCFALGFLGARLLRS